MVETPDLSAGQQGAVGGAAGTAIADATVGLERAWSAAGGVLEGIFGGAPWDMAWTSIVDAVGGGGGEAAAVIVPYALEFAAAGGVG